MTVFTSNSDHALSGLKLFLPNGCPAHDELPHPCDKLAKSFEAATGWVLGFQESSFSKSVPDMPIRETEAASELILEPALQPNSGSSSDPGSSPISNNSDQANTVRLGKILITDLSADWPPRKPAASRRKCDEMAAAIDELFNELNRTKLELQTAQKERAHCSVQTNPAKQASSLPKLTVSLLASAVKLAEADKAVLFLLDDQDRYLVAQSSVGLSDKDFSQLAARSLRNSKADVEALAGAAIVMECNEQVQLWDCPLDGQSAICIPVSSATTLMGTLWISCDRPQEYSDEQLNMLEIVAGRLAAEYQLAELSRNLPVGTVPVESKKIERANSTSASETFGVASSEAAQFAANDLPFTGWKAEVRNQPGSYAGWFVDADEQLVAVSIHSMKNLCDPTYLDAIVQAAVSQGCDFAELVEALELALDTDLETASVELVFAVVDPFGGEVNIRRVARKECEEDEAEANEMTPVSIFEVACDKNRGENRPHEWVEYIEGEYFGFLCRGNSLTIGGSIGSKDLSQIVISRA